MNKVRLFFFFFNQYNNGLWLFKQKSLYIPAVLSNTVQYM